MMIYHNAKVYYDECHVLFIVILNVFMLSVIMLSVIMLSVVVPIIVRHLYFMCLSPIYKYKEVFELRNDKVR
jgi:hypothetical protein